MGSSPISSMHMGSLQLCRCCFNRHAALACHAVRHGEGGAASAPCSCAQCQAGAHHVQTRRPSAARARARGLDLVAGCVRGLGGGGAAAWPWLLVPVVHLCSAAHLHLGQKVCAHMGACVPHCQPRIMHVIIRLGAGRRPAQNCAHRWIVVA